MGPGLFKQFGARCFRLTTVKSPEVGGPGRSQIESAKTQWARYAVTERAGQIGSDARPASRKLRERLRACDANLRLLLQNALCGNANIEVICESDADQFLQFWVVKDLQPGLVTE
jgi:hypothetical protein